MPVIDIDKIRRYFSTQPVSKAWLFGSFARGEQTDDSDVDLLVTLDDGVGLFKFAAMNLDLEELLKKAVDLVSDQSLLPWVQSSVNEDRLLIYEREASR